MVIDNLHKGMNLRDSSLNIDPGETRESLGLDFSTPGLIKPMRAGLLKWTMDADIEDAHIVYLSGTKYLFTTHADGLRVTDFRSSGAILTSTLIDADFTGAFSIVPINDAVVYLSNATLVKKWIPGDTATLSWGLNTPDTPTVAAGVATTKTIEDFEDLGDWVAAGGSVAADITHFKDGTQSMQLDVAANGTVVASRVMDLDLSILSATVNKTAASYINLSYYTADLSAVHSIRLKFSCEVGGGFTKDYYYYDIQLYGQEYVKLAPTGLGVASSVVGVPTDQSPDSLIFNPVSSQYEPAYTSGWNPQATIQTEYDPTTNIIVQYYQKGDQRSELQTFDLSSYVIKTQDRTTSSKSGSWTDLKIQAADFVRIGATAGRDWSTITAVSIEVVASAAAATVSFDTWQLVGGGNLWGYYWAAVAYQNELGNYGPFSDFAGPVYLEAQSMAITGLTADTDEQTVSRRIVILGGSISQPMVTYLEDNTSTTLDYNETDDSLVTVETNFNNKPPTACTSMVEAVGRIFMVKETGDLIYSEPLLYEAFPLKNYRTMAENDQLEQVAVQDQYLMVRGKKCEHEVLLSGGPSDWPIGKGAPVGTENAKFILDLTAGHIFASQDGFYLSGRGVGRDYYLPKINRVVRDFSTVKGALAGQRAYIGFTDSDGTSRVLRMDFRLGAVIAHYVENIAPEAIFGDEIANEVYYTDGDEIYIFDGDTGTPMSATKLVIPGQWGGSHREKDFSLITYELSGGPLTMTLTADRRAVSGSYTLADAEQERDPVSLPPIQARRLEITLTATDKDFELRLPIELIAVEI